MTEDTLSQFLDGPTSPPESNQLEPEQAAAQIADNISHRVIKPQVFTEHDFPAPLEHVQAPELRPDSPESSTVRSIAHHKRQNLWLVAKFHPYYGQAIGLMSGKQAQRARIYAEYKATVSFEQHVQLPELEDCDVEPLRKWRQACTSWPPASITYEDRRQWSVSIRILSEEIVTFEKDVMKWSRACLMETLWALANIEQNRGRFLESGRKLPPHLEPPVLFSRPTALRAGLDSFLPLDIATSATLQIADPSYRPIRRNFFIRGWLVVQEANAETEEGPLVAYGNVKYWISPPSNTPALRRCDGTFGEHDESLVAGWYRFGGLPLAFQPNAPLGNWRSLQHSDLQRDMAWYTINWRHFMAIGDQYGTRSVPGPEITYRMGEELAASLRQAMQRVLKDVESWADLHPWAVQCLSHESLRTLPTSFGHLTTMELYERTVKCTLVDFQTALRKLRGWIEYNARTSDLEARAAASHPSRGRGLVHSLNLDVYPPRVRGVHCNRQSQADAANQLGAPAWFYKREGLHWEPPLPMPELQIVEVPFESWIWSDLATDQLAPHLRPLRDKVDRIRATVLKSLADNLELARGAVDTNPFQDRSFTARTYRLFREEHPLSNVKESTLRDPATLADLQNSMFYGSSCGNALPADDLVLIGNDDGFNMDTDEPESTKPISVTAVKTSTRPGQKRKLSTVEPQPDTKRQRSASSRSSDVAVAALPADTGTHQARGQSLQMRDERSTFSEQLSTRRYGHGSSHDYDGQRQGSSRDYDRERHDSSRGFDRQRRESERDYDGQWQGSSHDYDGERRDSSRDFDRQRRESARDYDRQGQGSSRDYDRERHDSSRGFDRQRRESERDYDGQWQGSSHDYDRERRDSSRDFDRQRRESARDYDRQGQGSSRDYNRQRQGPSRDHDQHLSRDYDQSSLPHLDHHMPLQRPTSTRGAHNFSAAARRKAESVDKVDRSDEAKIMRGEALDSKKPKIRLLTTSLPDWYPKMWPVAHAQCEELLSAAQSMTQRDIAHRIASPDVLFSVPQRETKRRVELWRTMPTDMLTRKQSHNEHKAFSFIMAALPDLRRFIATSTAGDPDAEGLDTATWASFSTGHGRDYGKGWDATKAMLRKLGKIELIDRIEGRVVQQITIRRGDPLFLPDDEDVVDWEESYAINLESDPHDLRYFVPEAVPALEEDRWKEEPDGWRWKQRGQRNQRSKFKWFMPGDWNEGTGKCDYEFEDSDILEWQLVLPDSAGFEQEKFKRGDVWECYTYGLILILPRFGDPDHAEAMGARLLKPSKFYELGSNRQRRWLFEGLEDGGSARVFCDLRVWHGHNETIGLSIPVEPLGYIGMYNQNLLFRLPYEEACQIYPRNAVLPPEMAGEAPPKVAPPQSTSFAYDPAEHVVSKLVCLRPGARIIFDGVDAGVYNPPQDKSSYEYPASSIRRRVAYNSAALEFCAGLMSLDELIRGLYQDKADLQAMTSAERRALIMCIASGTGGGIGNYAALNITSNKWLVRMPCTRALHNLMSGWPHIDLPSLADAERDQRTFELFESALWRQYVQSSLNFVGRCPSIPPVFDPSADAGHV